MGDAFIETQDHGNYYFFAISTHAQRSNILHVRITVSYKFLFHVITEKDGFSFSFVFLGGSKVCKSGKDKKL